ncbi:MAG: c-type cytochrome biogenesis protein CcmF, partial [Methylococcales bacterium]|nr:c-type cytochrome biogenesis protein CcmF [Methylococcales bacterium]
SEKRGVLKAWTVLLAVLAFSLSLLGTFLVRSGVLTSVHSFASDPTRGLYILLFLGVVVGGSLTLFAFRSHQLRSSATWELVSRESGLLLNNVLLVVACAAVVLGTLYPLFIDALNLGKLSVGAQYFNAVFVPLMLPIVLLIGVGAMLNWKRDRLAGRKVMLGVLIVLSIVGAIVLVTRFSSFRLTAVAAIAMALWVTLTTLYGVVYRFRNKRNRLSAVMHTPASFWGMSIAHIGIAMFTAGVAITSIYNEEQTVRMAVGDTHEIGGYTLEYTAMNVLRGSNYEAAGLDFDIRKGDREIGSLTAEKRFYDTRGNVMTEAGIDASFLRDIFVAPG